MLYTVTLSERACADLQQARDYIRQQAPDAAERWYLSILTAMLRLEKNPQAFPLAPENTQFDFELRQFLFRSKSRRANRVLFRITGTKVQVLAIRRPGLPLLSRSDLEHLPPET